jgi:beta-lactamase superfamily II metal-dependent hydrolase
MEDFFAFLWLMTGIGAVISFVLFWKKREKKQHPGRLKHVMIGFLVVSIISFIIVGISPDPEADESNGTTTETFSEDGIDTTTLMSADIEDATTQGSTETEEEEAKQSDESSLEEASETEADQTAATTKETKAAETESTTTEAIQAPSGELTVHFIDVGQGDAILIQQGAQAMLIDAGDNHMGRTVVNYIKNQGITKLDYLIGTHPHADHIGGLTDVIPAFDIGKIILPDMAHTTKTFEDMLLAIQAKGLKITKAEPGNSYTLGSTNMQILGPVNIRSNDLNNASVVCKVSFGSTAFMFTGDVESRGEGDILNKEFNLSADVLKVSHHGSSTSSTQAFLNAVSADHAVIMVGEGNRYDHPAKELLDRLTAMDMAVYRTDLAGTIVAVSDGSKISFNKNPKLGTAGGSTSSPTTVATTTAKETTAATTTAEETTKATTTAKETTTETVQEGAYIGNLNTKKFHLPSCSSLPNPENRTYFDTRQTAIDAGYDPCGRCNP